MAEKHLRTQFPLLTKLVSTPRFKAAAKANATTPETLAVNVLIAAAESAEQCALKRPLKKVFVQFQ